MAKAKIVKAFPGVEDGKVYPRMIEVGEVIEGDLARVAIEEKWGEPVTDAAAAEAAAQESAADVGHEATASEARAEQVAAAAPEPVVIPADWKSMKWANLKAMADKVKGSEVSGAEEARRVILEELARREAAKAPKE
jgi:hypothetical protein